MRPRSFVSVQWEIKGEAASPPVWVGLSISADAASERLAPSRQAAVVAGPPSPGPLSCGLEATYINASKCSACLSTSSFRGSVVFTC